MLKIKTTFKLIENVHRIVDNSRTHTIVCDLPPTKGEDDTGLTVLELAIMALPLADCAATIFADVSKQSKIDIKKLRVITETEKPSDPLRLNEVNPKVYVSA